MKYGGDLSEEENMLYNWYYIATASYTFIVKKQQSTVNKGKDIAENEINKGESVNSILSLFNRNM